MARYLTFFNYTGDAVARMVNRPGDRSAAARGVVEAAGGRLESFYWMFGDHDGLVIYEVPDAVTAGAVCLAVATSGLIERIETHQLLDSEEALTALKRAASLTPAYQAPGAPWREDYDALG